MNQTVPLLFICLLTLISPLAGGEDPFRHHATFGSPEILPVEEAFNLGAYEDSGGTRVFWQVLPGYYLYRDRFAFNAQDKAVKVELPEGALRQDEIFGEVQVLEGLVEVFLPYAIDDIEVSFQGCAERGYCYPPQKTRLSSLK